MVCRCVSGWIGCRCLDGIGQVVENELRGWRRLCSHYLILHQGPLFGTGLQATVLTIRTKKYFRLHGSGAVVTFSHQSSIIKVHVQFASGALLPRKNRPRENNSFQGSPWLRRSMSSAGSVAEGC